MVYYGFFRARNGGSEVHEIKGWWHACCWVFSNFKGEGKGMRLEQMSIELRIIISIRIPPMCRYGCESEDVIPSRSLLASEFRGFTLLLYP